VVPRVQLDMTFGDRDATPFVHFVSGCAHFPPNALRRDAAEVLVGFEKDSTGGFMGALLKTGNLGGSYTITLESTWYAYLRDFLLRNDGFANLENRLAALRLVANEDISKGWADLKNYLLNEIDEVSGWNYCWRKEDERLKATWRKGHECFFVDRDLGGVVRVIGGATLPETRTQFITDDILQPFGRVRRCLNMFAAFAVADDFSRNGTNYPRSVRLIVWDPQYGILNQPNWHVSQFISLRPLRWRPDNNLCDPEWLACQLVAAMTDNADRDVWQETIDSYNGRPDPLEDLPYQMDFVLETGLRIGATPEVCLEFEGRRLRWINGTTESRPLLSVRCANRGHEDYRLTTEMVNRFLSAIAWECKISVVNSFSVGTAKRPTPAVSGARTGFGIQVSAAYLLQSGNEPPSDQRRLALALYKEGLNSPSVFYKFLNFWKILEVGVKKKAERDRWIGASLSKVPSGLELMGREADALKYLEHSCRNAISHVWRPPIIDPDNYEDTMRLQKDVIVVDELAQEMIKTVLAK
jgi:hypothetical protein